MCIRDRCVALDAAFLQAFRLQSGAAGAVCAAYNLGNFLRRLVLPRKIKHWFLRSLLVKLIKIGAKVVRHSGYITFQMAEVTIDQELFAEILSRIKRLRYPAV